MKFLVLGSEGQIGNPTVEYLTELGHDVMRWDILRSTEEDLRNYCYELIVAMENSDFVIYLASDVGGAKYLAKHQDTIQFICNNMAIMRNVFEALKTTGTPFLFTSSQMSELSHSTYGILKKLGEKMTTDLGGLFVRLWNIYGPEHDIEKSHVITDFCRMAKQDGVIKMRTNGVEKRQFLHVLDCAEAFLTIAEQYESLDHSANYHITSFKWHSMLDVAGAVQAISGCDVIPGIATDQVQMNAMNPPDEFIRNFWQPVISLQDGVKRIYDNT